MIKAIINNEEVVSNKDLTISEELLKTSSTILNNCYPKSWETAHDYISNFYFPKDYSKCCLYNETIITPITGQTVNGTNFTIDYDDTLNSRLEKIEGDTFQNSYTGKNLLNPSTLTTGTINGITCSYNNTTKIITFNGKCTKDNTIFDFSSITILFQANKTKQIIYYESGTLTNYGQFRSFSSSYGAGIIMDMTQLSSSNNKMMRSNTFDVEKTRFSFRFNNGSVANNFKVKVMITNDDNTDFEPYVGKTASPNPDYPQNIEVVTGYNEVAVVGKNLFDNAKLNTYFASGNLFNGERGASTTSYIPAKAGDIFTISTQTASLGIVIASFDANYTCLSRTAVGSSSLSLTHTCPANTAYVIGSNYIGMNTNTQLEKSSTATNYEPYQSQSYEVNLGKNLLDISAVTSTSYITNNGDGSITLNGVGTGGISFSLSKPFTLKANITYIMSLTNTNSNYAGSTFILRNGNTNILQQQFSNKLISYKPTNDVIIDTIRIYAPNTITFDNFTFSIQLEKGSTATSYSPYFTPIELCKIGTYQDYIYRDNGNWYLHKEISKLVLDGSDDEDWSVYGLAFILNFNHTQFRCFCDKFTSTTNQTWVSSDTSYRGKISTYNSPTQIKLMLTDTSITTLEQFKTWLSTHNTTIYYVLTTPTNTLITNETLIEQLNRVALINGINNVNVISPNLSGSIQIYYNYRIGETIDDLIFCGLVKNTGNISLNPREPHYCDLQVLDFKTMLSEGQTLDFVISNQTIGQAIERVIEEISSYGFVLGEIDIDAENDVIGAYSTLNKTPYDVFQYLADISQSKWFTRVIDENTIAIDFYDSDKLPVADNIEYTQEYFKQNNIVDISFSFNSNDYRNKQIILSQQVYGNVDVIDDVISNGYNTSFTTTQIIGNVTNITVDGVAKTFTTNAEKNIGLTADFYYTPNSDKFESDSPYTAGSQITIEYTPLIKGRRIVNNNVEINRINEQIDRNGTISRYEERNDILDGDELTKVAETYIKYKGEKEITLNITTLNNDLFNIGEQVYFDMPYVNDLSTTYLVKKKDIQITQIGESGNVFYEYSLSSNFNSESDINYFDNQRRKAEGNITEDNFITRNIDIQDSANIIFDNLNIVEITMTGDNVLNSPLNSPFNN